MAYRLKKHEEVPEGMRRVFREQFKRVIEKVRVARNCEDVAHALRKSLKRLRSALRLMQRGTGHKASNAKAKRLLSNVAHEMAPIRDAQVRLRVLEALEKQISSSVDPELRRRISEDRNVKGGDRLLLRKVIRQLKAANRDLVHWPFEKLSWWALRYGMDSACKKCLKAHRRAAKDRSDENLHNWRKRVKDLWCHARLLRAIAPRRMRRLEQRLKTLGKLLGDDHDLALLEKLMIGLRHEETTGLATTITARRRKLQKAALRRDPAEGDPLIYSD